MDDYLTKHLDDNEAADRYAEPTMIGQYGNQIQALACKECGSVIWDFRKHAEAVHGWK